MGCFGCGKIRMSLNISTLRECGAPNHTGFWPAVGPAIAILRPVSKTGPSRREVSFSAKPYLF